MNHQTTYRTWNRCVYRVPSLWPPNAVICKIWTFSQCCVSWLLAGLVFLRSEISTIMFIIASMHGLWEQEMCDLWVRIWRGHRGSHAGPIMGPCSAPSHRCRRCEQRSVKPSCIVLYIRAFYTSSLVSRVRKLSQAYGLQVSTFSSYRTLAGGGGVLFGVGGLIVWRLYETHMYPFKPHSCKLLA